MTFSHKNKRPIYRPPSAYWHNPVPSFQLYQNLAANMLLVPGSYTATAMAEQLDPSFRINAGETRDIMLGN